MNKFGYRVYYQYSGPTKEDPFLDPKSEDELSHAFWRFPDDLRAALDDPKAQVVTDEKEQSPSSITVVVTTMKSEQTVDEDVRYCCEQLDLFAKKLRLE